MLVTIRTEDGREFSGSDIKEAQRVAARVKREEKRKADRDMRNYETAKRNAESVAFRLINSANQYTDGVRREIPRGFTFHRAGVEEYADAKINLSETGVEEVEIFGGYSEKDGSRIMGRMKWYHKDKLIGYIANSAGCLALVVRWNGAESDSVVAVGIHDGTVATADVPPGLGVDVERFRQGNKN